MTDQQTMAKHAFVPEVWADMVQAAFKGRARVLPHALQRDDLAGQPGDTIKFPKWNTLKDLDDLTENVPMVPEALDQTVGEAKIKEAGKAVEITDTRDLVGLGNVETEAVRQFGMLVARKIDADLITAAAAETNADNGQRIREQKPYVLDKSTGNTTALSWSVLVDALAMFGDEWEPSDFAGLFVRSEQVADLMRDPQFVDASKLGTVTPVSTGQVGIVAGMPVVVTNRLPAKQFLILKPNALGVMYKRRPVVEHDRDILKRTTVVTTNVHYAVKRLDDKGVLVGKLK